MIDPIERLRAELASQVPRHFRVTAKSTQYYMDEDTAAFCAIDVQPGASHGFGIVVVPCRDERRDALMIRVWHGFADEVWLVDPVERTILVTRHDGEPSLVRAGETLGSGSVPGLAIDVAALFA